MNLPGSELYWDPQLGQLQRWYCRLLGVPIVGLRIRVRRIDKLLPQRATKILDAGCGRGVISRHLAQRYPGAQVDAMDTDADAQQRNTTIARHTGLTNCNFVIGNLNDLAQATHYDLIVSVDNLEHIEDDRRVIGNFFQSMQPGGTLLIHVPHYYRRWPIISWRRNFDVPGHIRPGYHLAELTEKVTEAGFNILRKGFSYGFLENLSNNISYRITKAEEKNLLVYAMIFPFLNFLAWGGQWSRPNYGAGVWISATKPMDDKYRSP